MNSQSTLGSRLQPLCLNQVWCGITVVVVVVMGSWMVSSAGTSAAYCHRLQAQDHSFIAYQSVAGHPDHPAPRLDVCRMGGGSWWACWPDTFWLGRWSF